MKLLTLRRVSNTVLGTFGVLLKEDRTPLCNTLELPWHDNERDVSCIPVGMYKIYKVGPTAQFNYDHFRLKGVPVPRSDIVIHRGNTVQDTKGCILLGNSWVDAFKHNGLPGIGHSKASLLRLLSYLRNEIGDTALYIQEDPR